MAIASAVALAALAACGSGGSDDGSATSKPSAPEGVNVVVIMTDDQTAESMRVMPEVAELIGDAGTTFDDSIVSFPVCCPSRATFLTGQYAHNHGVRTITPPHGGYGWFRDEETTLPAALEAAGYDTIHIGKYLNGYGVDRPPAVPSGWTEWHGAIDPSTYEYYGFTLLEDGEERTYGPDEYQTDVYTDLAVDAIREHASGDRPFFLNIAYLAPHLNAVETDAGGPSADSGAAGDRRDVRTAVPAPRHDGTFDDEAPPSTPDVGEEDVSDKPPRFRDLPPLDDAALAAIAERYQQALASLLAVDEGVARIIEALDDEGELDDTVVVFTSDNGFFYGEHRIEDGKAWFYEPSIRVPLLVRGPGVQADSTVSSLVANIDLAPTIFELTGVSPLRPVDGRSLVPLLTDGDGAAPDGGFEDRAVLLDTGGPFAPHHGVRTPTHLYVEYSDGERELYDLVADPHQLDNRVDDPALAEVQADLAARLATLEGCSGEACH
ncbi:MAG: sulfatase [Acidimicrobiales bacterium]